MDGLSDKSKYEPDVATAAKPATADALIKIAILFAEVSLPLLSTVNLGTKACEPSEPAVTPVIVSLADGKNPVFILAASVVSVVADVAKPVTCEDDIDIATLAADVILP